MIEPREIAFAAVKALDDKKAENIKLLHIGELTVMADYFIICSGTSSTHINTLCDEVSKKLETEGEPPLRIEGYRSGAWVLMDFGSVIVHIFTDEMRKFYGLERLWSDAAVVDIDHIITK